MDAELDPEVPVPEDERAMEDAGEYDGEDSSDIFDTDIEPDKDIEADEDDVADTEDDADFVLAEPPTELVADDVDD